MSSRNSTVWSTSSKGISGLIINPSDDVLTCGRAEFNADAIVSLLTFWSTKAHPNGETEPLPDQLTYITILEWAESVLTDARGAAIGVQPPRAWTEHYNETIELLWQDPGPELTCGAIIIELNGSNYPEGAQIWWDIDTEDPSSLLSVRELLSNTPCRALSSQKTY